MILFVLLLRPSICSGHCIFKGLSTQNRLLDLQLLAGLVELSIQRLSANMSILLFAAFHIRDFMSWVFLLTPILLPLKYFLLYIKFNKKNSDGIFYRSCLTIISIATFTMIDWWDLMELTSRFLKKDGNCTPLNSRNPSWGTKFPTLSSHGTFVGLVALIQQGFGIEIFHKSMVTWFEQFKCFKEDDGYISKAPFMLKYPKRLAIPEEQHAMINCKWSCQETANFWFKKWRILHDVYCKDISKHYNIFAVIDVITYLAIYNGKMFLQMDYTNGPLSF